jgi:hypothetical protein
MAESGMVGAVQYPGHRDICPRPIPFFGRAIG